MDLFSVLGAMTTTGVVSVAAAHFLTKHLLEHRLSKDMKDYEARIQLNLAAHKADLDRSVNVARAESEAHLRRELEEYLGERSAERSYRVEAKKRLYLAVGPLRFQLAVAAAEFANRVARIGDGTKYNMSMRSYFGQSNAYRLLRVLAVAELIERQIAYADFAVDPAMRSLLKFKRDAFVSLSNRRVSLGHPDEDWTRQDQHVFYDVLGIIASALIVHDVSGDEARAMRFDEFSDRIDDPEFAATLDPVLRLLDGFDIQERPIVWLRLLALSSACQGLLETHGTETGLEIEPTDLTQALMLTSNQHIIQHVAEYERAIEWFRTSRQPLR